MGTVGVLAVFAFLAAISGGYFSQELYAASLIMWAMLGFLVLIVWERVEITGGVAFPVFTLSAMAAWILTSSLWSLSPNLTLQEFGHAALYLAAFLAVLIGPRNRISVILSSVLFILVSTAIASFALLAKVIPDLSENYLYAGGRLMGSVGYWNGLAVLMVMALVPCLWLASSASIPRAGRVGATIAFLIMALTLFFTLSRGGILIGAVSIAIFIALAPDRLGSVFTLISAMLPGSVIIWYTIVALPSLQTAQTGARIDAGEGRSFALVLLAAIASCALLKAVSLFLPARMPKTRNGLVIIAACWIGVIAASGGFAALERQQISNKISEWQSTTDVKVYQYNQGSIDTRGVQRLASTADNRAEFWRIGLTNFQDHPLFGTGGGTYRFANARLRSGEALARDPHSIWVRFLSDQGIIGFFLLAAFVISLVWVYFSKMRASRRIGTALWRDGLYLALGVSSLAWLVDSSLEWNWELPAVGLPFFLLTGLAFRLGESEGMEVPDAALAEASDTHATGSSVGVPAWGKSAIVGASLILTMVFLALLLSTVESDRAENKLSEGDLGGAESTAIMAHRFNYFASEPLHVRSRVAESVGNFPAARDFMASALNREPQRSAYQEDLALIEFYDLGETDQGLGDLNKAVNLDPQDQPLHLQLQRMYSDKKQFDLTGVMPERPQPTQY